MAAFPRPLVSTLCELGPAALALGTPRPADFLVLKMMEVFLLKVRCFHLQERSPVQMATQVSEKAMEKQP